MSRAPNDDLEVNYRPHLPMDRGAPILDLGCGRGRVLEWLTELGYDGASGVDIDPDAVAWVDATITRNVEAVDDVGRWLAGREETWDVVVARHVVYYFERRDLVPTLRLVRNALRPGGRLLVEVFNGAAFTGPYVQYKDPAIAVTLAEGGLRRALEAAGFTSVAVGALVLPPRSLTGWAYHLANRTWQTALRGVYLLERGVDPENPTILGKSLFAVAER